MQFGNVCKNKINHLLLPLRIHEKIEKLTHAFTQKKIIISFERLSVIRR